MKKLIFLALLTACGTNEMTDEQKQNALVETEASEEIPDLSQWQIMADAKEFCSKLSSDDMSCTTEFTAVKNCSDATFKFIAKSQGYMHIVTVEHVIVRQGEAHKIEFNGKPETYNIDDEFANEQYHAFQCYDQNGDVIKL